MKIHCVTNLDKYYRCSWPSEMLCRPMVGDYVEAAEAVNGILPILRVVAVTHVGSQRKGDEFTPQRDAFLRVELNK